LKFLELHTVSGKYISIFYFNLYLSVSLSVSFRLRVRN